MRKILLCIILLVFPIISNAGADNEIYTDINNESIYASLDLSHLGLKEDVFAKAIKGWNKLKLTKKLLNPSIITIIDFSQSSNNKRMYVVDVQSKKLLYNTYVAHGKNTGDEYAMNFSNEPNSLKSSLGFYVTEESIISPKHGLALLIKGEENGFNDNAEKREIIIHSADYVTENFIKENGRLGRSFGCPAIPPEFNEQIIETIKIGTCLFIYYPDKNYLNNSTLLN